MSNVVPVASRTGIAPDIIEHGKNGYIFDLDAPAAAIADLIEKASQLSGNVRASVEHLTWRRFGRQVHELAGLASSAMG